MRPESITTRPTNGTNTEKNKMSKKQIIGLVALSLIAIGGVLFGIYGMNSQNEQIAELTTRATDAEGKVAEMEVERVEINDGNSAVVEEEAEIKNRAGTGDDEVNGGVSISNANGQADKNYELGVHVDYIYVGEWGIKIRVPENLIITGYKFVGGGNSYGQSLSISGVKGQTGMKVPQYAFGIEYTVGGVVRATTENGFFPYGSLAFTDSDGYNYYYEAANGYPNVSEFDADLWMASRKAVGDILMNSENYSAI